MSVFMERRCDNCGAVMPLFEEGYLSNPNTAAVAWNVSLPKDLCSNCRKLQ